MPFRLVGAESTAVGRIAVQYSIDGGGHWLPAVAVTGTLTTTLATSPTGVEHIFTWDPLASGFFGRSDNVALRLVVYPSLPSPLQPGTYRYVNTAAGPFQRACCHTDLPLPRPRHTGERGARRPATRHRARLPLAGRGGTRRPAHGWSLRALAYRQPGLPAGPRPAGQRRPAAGHAAYLAHRSLRRLLHESC